MSWNNKEEIKFPCFVWISEQTAVIFLFMLSVRYEVDL